MLRPVFFALALLVGGCVIDNGNEEEGGDSGVSIELKPSTLKVRPGKSTTLQAFVRGSTTWNTATCTVTMGTCTMHVVAPQEFSLEYKAPGVHGTATLTFAHDGNGGRPGSTPKALSATATISLEGRITAALLPDWQSSSHAGRVSDVVFSADGNRIASAGLDDNTIKIDDWASGKNLASLTVFTQPGGTVFDAPTSVDFVPGAPAVLVGTTEFLVRLKDGKGEETGRVKPELPDAAVDNNAPRAVQDIACNETTKKCALVRGPGSTAGCIGNGCECRGCKPGLFLVEKPADEALAVRTLAIGDVNQTWTRVAWSPDGTKLAVIGGPQVRYFDAATGAEVTTSFDVGDAPAPGSAGWHGRERFAMVSALHGGPFTLVEGNTTRRTLGPYGTFVDAAAARDAGYLVMAIQRATGSDQDNGLWVYAKDTGAELARLDAKVVELGHTFDMCTTGELVFEGASGGLQLATPGGYTPHPLEIQGETLTGPVFAIRDPILDRVSRTAGCHMLVGAGQNKSLIVNVNERTVARTLPFGAAAQTNTFGDRFLIQNTVFGAKARVLDEQGNLVYEIPENVKRWCSTDYNPCGLDAQGMFHTWQWGNDCAAGARPCTGLAHAPPFQISAPEGAASFSMPRRIQGDLFFPLGMNIAFRKNTEVGENITIKLEHGNAEPYVVLVDPGGTGHHLIAGGNFVLSYPSTPIADRILDALAP